MAGIRRIIVWTLALAFVGGLGSMACLAQKVHWGESYPLVHPPNYMQIAMASEDGSVVLVGHSSRIRQARRNFLLTRSKARPPRIHQASLIALDDSMTIVKAIPLLPNYKGESVDLGQCFQAQGKLYLYGSTFAQGRADQLVLQTFDLDLQTHTAMTAVATPEAGGFPLTPGARWNFAASKDSTALLLHAFSPKPSPDTTVGMLLLYDGAMQPRWQRTVRIPPGMSVQDCMVDDSGNVVVLAVRRLQGMGLRREGKPNAVFQVLRFVSPDSQQVYSLTAGDTLLSAMKMSFAPSGKIVCGGYFSLGGINQIEGSYFARIDPKLGRVVASRTTPFHKGLWADHKTKPDSAKVWRMKDFRLDHAIARADGGVILIGEQLFVSTFNLTWGNGVTGMSNAHHCIDVMAVDIAPDGKAEWASTLRKRQVTNDFGRFTSYTVFVGGAHIDLLYNEHRKNLDPIHHRRIRNFSLGYETGVMALASLSTDGAMDREILCSNRDFRANCEPRLSFQVAPRRVLLFGIGVNSIRFGELRY
jgi:hypothetical protein